MHAINNQGPNSELHRENDENHGNSYIDINDIDTSARYVVKKIVLMNRFGMTSSYKYADVRIHFKRTNNTRAETNLDVTSARGATRLSCDFKGSMAPLLFDSHDETARKDFGSPHQRYFPTRNFRRMSMKAWLPKYIINVGINSSSTFADGTRSMEVNPLVHLLKSRTRRRFDANC